ncbi:MAG: hypothetical protein HQ525_09085 [Anaerolineae bacterium]|nr:hypothetical protein [Anaerolineae bacterium]
MHYSAAYSALLYLDPGSGSILIQLAVAALLGAGLFIRSQWSKIKKMFGKDIPEVNEEENADDDFEE